MSFIVDKIIEAFSEAIAADAVLSADLPGGVWHQKVASAEQGIEGPYAVVKVMPGTKESQSDLTATQPFIVTVRIWAGQDTTAAGGIADALDIFSFGPSLLKNIPARILLLMPTLEMCDIDPEEYQGQDVLIASRSWSLLLHVAIAPQPQQIGA